jgi:hypothetical protein
MVTPAKKKKLSGNTGQLDSKRYDEDTEIATDEVKRSTLSKNTNFNTL